MAKLALWLETVAADAPLTFLDHHMRCGDSVIGARIRTLDNIPGEAGLLEDAGSHLRLTREGRFLADSVVVALL